MASRTKPRRWVRIWRKHLRPLLVLVIVLCAFRSAVADWNDVPTGSMKPTILEGDRIFVNKLAYGLKAPFTNWRLARWSAPDRGDVVVFYSPADGTRLVKRIVGIGGDEIEMRNNQLWINGAPAGYAAAPVELKTAGREDARQRTFMERIDGEAHPVRITPDQPARRSFGPTRVPADHYFVLGDNRDLSADSRYFGFVPRSEIVGRANWIALSLDRDHSYLPRWDRFLRKLK